MSESPDFGITPRIGLERVPDIPIQQEWGTSSEPRRVGRVHA